MKNGRVVFSLSQLSKSSFSISTGLMSFFKGFHRHFTSRGTLEMKVIDLFRCVGNAVERKCKKCY